jgi:transposase InsO family protein
VNNLHARSPKEYQVKALCGLFGVSKQAYYKHDDDKAMLYMAQEEFVVQYIREVRVLDPGIGGRKLWEMYRREFQGNNPVGRDRFMDIVDRYGLKVRQRIRTPRTTDSTHNLPVYPNLVKGYIPMAPNRLVVSDITYIVIWVDEYTYEFCYLSMVLDAYTEEIVGWSVGESLSTKYPVEALVMAFDYIRHHGGDTDNLIHHSDRGCQYASHDYVNMLMENNVKISMTESGDPKDNAQAECINNTMKNELLKGMTFKSVDEVRAAVAKAVEFYNKRRPHMSIDMMTPLEARQYSGPIEKRWRSYREEALAKTNPAIGLSYAPVQGFPSRLRPPVNPCTE